ncbi:MAG: hypothetical protein WC734_05935 [Patescibacteria group bacterium]
MYKIKVAAGIAGALITLGTVFYWLGSTSFVTRSEFTVKCAETDRTLAVQDKTMAVMQTDIIYIKQGVDNINRKLDR